MESLLYNVWWLVVLLHTKEKQEALRRCVRKEKLQEMWGVCVAPNLVLVSNIRKSLMCECLSEFCLDPRGYVGDKIAHGFRN